MATVRKGWNTGFFTAPDAIYDIEYLSGYAKSVYLFLCRCADSEQQAFPGYATIASKTSFSKKTVQRAIQELVENGFLIKENRYNAKKKKWDSNMYTLIHPEDVVRKQEQQEKENQGEGMVCETIPMVCETSEGLHNKDNTLNQTQQGKQQQHAKKDRLSKKEEAQLGQSGEVVVVDPILSFAKQNNIRLTERTLKKWRDKTDDATIMIYLAHAIRIQAKNVCAWVTTAIDEQFDLSSVSEVTATSEKKKVKSVYLEKLRRAGAK